MMFKCDNDKKYVDDLKNHIINCYELNVTKVMKASRGLDGETWIIIANRKKYFVKISYYSTHKDRFINSIKTLNILNSNSIKHVNSVIKSRSGKDFVEFNNGILAIYTFVKGEIDYSYPFNKIIKLLTPVYRIDTKYSALISEKYDTDNIISKLKNQIDSSLKPSMSKIINNNKNKIEGYLKGLEYYSKRINKQCNMYITHGDACVNVMVSKNSICLIDWDDSIVSPIERDCWFFIDSKSKIKYINNYFKRNKFNYILSNDMLFFYAYKRAVEYISELIEKYQSTSNSENIDEINEILNGWVNTKLECIKKIWGGYYDIDNI